MEAHSCFTAPLPHLSVSPTKPHTSCKNTRVTAPSTQQTFSQHSDIRNVQPDAPPVTQAKSSDVFTNSVVSAYHPASVQSQAYFICTELFFRAYVYILSSLTCEVSSERGAPWVTDFQLYTKLRDRHQTYSEYLAPIPHKHMSDIASRNTHIENRT